MFSFFTTINIRKILLAGFLLGSAVFSVYNFAYAERILPRVSVGPVGLGNLGQEDAQVKLEDFYKNFNERGITVVVEEDSGIIYPENIDFVMELQELIEKSFLVGRSGPWFFQLQDVVLSPFMARTIPLEIKYSEEKLLAEINLLKDRFDVPKKDVRYDIKGTNVEILTDTKAGWILDEDEAMNEIVERLRNLDSSTVTLYLREDKPVVSSDNSDFRKEGINKMLQNNLVLLFEGLRFEISKATIGSWVVSDYRNNHLIPGLDRAAISGYVTTLAEKIDTTPKSSFAKVENGKVVEFVPPKQGRYLAQAETVELVIDSLLARPEGKEVVRELSLPVVVKRASGGDESAQNFGIVELLGKATTPFTGSPKNRVLNIENGTKFLNGVLIAPGEEFSTVTSLGKIDNTTGYFPELVIKGDRTVPEFGGGLCQVSTTLFRAVMDAGLPVTERRNHSYRVSYYEYDGEEKYIGPGLDATIYSPNPDFKFKNDTDSHILLQGYVVGDKITFELYGTGDGRTAEVDGPKLLYTTSPGEPIYVETDKLPAGEVIKLESAHPGGSAVAIYKIIYPDGRVNEQEFKSSYRRWPDRYLVGTAGVSGESALPVVR